MIMEGAVLEGAGPGGYTLPRRGGRVVECGGLENRYVGNPGVGGSNPPLSAGPGFAGLRLSAFPRRASLMLASRTSIAKSTSRARKSPRHTLAEMLTANKR